MNRHEYSWNREPDEQGFDESGCLRMGPYEFTLKRGYEDVLAVETLHDSIDRHVRSVTRYGITDDSSDLVVAILGIFDPGLPEFFSQHGRFLLHSCDRAPILPNPVLRAGSIGEPPEIRHTDAPRFLLPAARLPARRSHGALHLERHHVARLLG